MEWHGPCTSMRGTGGPEHGGPDVHRCVGESGSASDNYGSGAGRLPWTRRGPAATARRRQGTPPRFQRSLNPFLMASARLEDPMEVTTTRPDPQAPRSPVPVLAGALRPGVV